VGDILDSVQECVDRTIATVGNHLVVGAPLGLGKPVQLMNAFYERALADASLNLHFVTALCLELPRPSSELEAKLSDPILERLFGDYEELAFIGPFRDGTLPENIQFSELYFKAGAMKKVAVAQQNYISSNYTHIVRDMIGLGVNVMVQMVAARETEKGLSLSLSCNPDLTLEIIDQRRESGLPALLLAQIHDELPFMELDAQVPAEAFDLIVQNSEYNKTLFAVPNTAVPLQDYAAALHASSLIVDGGTLQIGIGALGDAVAHACVVRHKENALYRSILKQLTHQQTHSATLPITPLTEDLGTFDEGLYISTEMFVNGMMQLIEQGIVKRKVYDNLTLQQGINSGAINQCIDERLFEFGRHNGLIPVHLDAVSLQELQYWGIIADSVRIEGDTLRVADLSLPNNLDNRDVRDTLLRETCGCELRNGRLLHGGFFLGPRDFYDKLRALDDKARDQICMTGVRRTNQLLLDYPLYSAQRCKARFINTGMMVALNGCVASDALEDGTVISGVGGQYNFVAMAQDLVGARSVLCIRSTRGKGKELLSNIVPFYGYATIPKHLRDIVVTEYGVADLRGQSDSQVIKRLINIADSRFQDSLLAFAKKHDKVEKDYSIPATARENTPERLQQVLLPFKENGTLPDYPFGTNLTEQELALAASLRKIKALSENPGKFIPAAIKALLHRADPEAAKPFLERINLEHPETTKEFLVQQLLLLDLEERGLLKVS
jgi:acyl-CoA hydrolase